MRDRCHETPPLPAVRACGFTLIELMVVIVVAGILAAIAIPSYQQYMIKSRREDARTTLSAMLQAQERYRSNNAAYASDPAVLLGGASGSAASSFKGHYDMTVAVVPGATDYVAGYELHAKPKSGDPQYGDTACADIYVRVSGGNLSYRDGTIDAADNTTTSACWPQ